VVDKDPVQNKVFISCHYQSADEHKSGVIVQSINWITGAPAEQQELLLKYRHGADMHPVTVTQLSDGSWMIKLHQESKQGIAAGQFAVLYDDQLCLGGGVIDKAF
jgi:tRNA-specific 2-thiouridylase